MVVAFHARLPLPGGFVGVDVFFVISGFVITAMLHREWISTGRIGYRQFYLRRFKRLTPALALTVAVTMLISALVLSPLGAQQTAAETAIGAMLLIANFVIASTTGAYFDAPAESNPLLNTWSLSVEEQFYLVFPALMTLGWYLARRRGLMRFSPHLIIGVIAIISFALAVAGNYGLAFPGSTSVLGFYGPFGRAWEFAVGALLALVLARWRFNAPRSGAALGVGGLTLLIASLWVINEATPFPGTRTLLPVTGTLLLLAAGTQGSAVTTRALSTRPMVKFGDWSYSIYLWHWPLIVFAVCLWPQSPLAAPIAAVISMVPALVSYHWVEQPLRRIGALGARRTILLITAVVVPPLFLSALVAGTATHYWTPRIESGDIKPLYPGDLGHQARFALMKDHYYPCTLTQVPDEHQEAYGVRRCMQSKPGRAVDLVVLGDSHAEHLFLGLAEALPETNVLYVYLHSWPSRDTENSRLTFRQIAALPTVKAVIVNSHWSLYVPRPTLTLSDHLSELTRAGKSVFLTDDVPDFPGMDPFQCKFQVALASPTICSREANSYRQEQGASAQWIQQIAQSIPGTTVLQTAKYFCSAETCDMTREGKLMYEDGDHLNADGSRYVTTRMLEDNPAVKVALSAR